MKKKEFQNLPSTETPITAENLNEMQDNIEESCVIVSPTEPNTNEKTWIQKGKNLIDINSKFEFGWYDVTNGVTYSVSNALFDYILVSSSTTYTLSVNRSIKGLSFAFFDIDKKAISVKEVNNTTSNTVTTPDNCYYVRVWLNFNDSDVMTISMLQGLEPQLELGEVRTNYELSNKKIYTKNDNGLFEEFYNENDHKIETVTTGTGTAIKFPDGTMICSGTVYTGTIEQSAWSNWGSLTSVDKSLSINFPVPFVSKPTITATNSSMGNNYWIVRCIATASQITSLSMSRGTLPSSSDYGFSYTAIGRWK